MCLITIVIMCNKNMLKSKLDYNYLRLMYTPISLNQLDLEKVPCFNFHSHVFYVNKFVCFEKKVYAFIFMTKSCDKFVKMCENADAIF